ncbi:MAG: hypothetical protein ABI165_15795, partial [Bryobacteraceae bacterium]
MKKFNFPLDRILQYRGNQVQLEESKLERLFATRGGIELRRRQLHLQRAENETALFASPSIASSELAALDQFRQFVDAQDHIMDRQLVQCDARIAAQRTRVLEARRQHQLLEKLRDKRAAHWQSECDRELEQQAAESFLAQWNRQGG